MFNHPTLSLMRTRLVPLFTILTLILSGVILPGAITVRPAKAATQTVTSLADDGSSNTLRSVIANATSGDTIIFLFVTRHRAMFSSNWTFLWGIAKTA